MPSGCSPNVGRFRPISTLSSKSETQRSLRRIKPGKLRKPLRPRPPADLTFLHQLERPFPKLLLDTTVYIDELQGKLPREVEISLRLTELWHSSITEAELIAIAGLLEPMHPETQKAVQQVVASIEHRPAHRILVPERDVWREAGIAAGLLARLQQYARAERQRTLNDALLLLSAAQHGCSVLTRNVRDFDLLMQAIPGTSAIFYDRPMLQP